MTWRCPPAPAPAPLVGERWAVRVRSSAGPARESLPADRGGVRRSGIRSACVEHAGHGADEPGVHRHPIGGGGLFDLGLEVLWKTEGHAGDLALLLVARWPLASRVHGRRDVGALDDVN